MNFFDKISQKLIIDAILFYASLMQAWNKHRICASDLRSEQLGHEYGDIPSILVRIDKFSSIQSHIS